MESVRFMFYYSLENAIKVYVAQQIANGSTQSCHDLPKQIAKSVARLGGTPFWLTAPT
jgi:hypothetical protein